MEGQKRSWPLKEVLIVVVVIAILAVIGYAINLDSKRKARTAEVPGSFHEILVTQIAFHEDPFAGNGRYASTIGSIGWQTGMSTYGNNPIDCDYRKGFSFPISTFIDHKYHKNTSYIWACGKYFAYGASEKNNCSDETTGVSGVGQALAYAAPAWALEEYPGDWQTGACTKVNFGKREQLRPSDVFDEWMRKRLIKAFELHHK